MEQNTKMVNTNLGAMPIDDYLEIVAMQSGFDSYEDMCKAGYKIDVDKI